MEYLIFTDIKEAEAHQVKVDAELKYPESLDSLRHVGMGIHAPKEIGRALHYSEIQKHDKEDQWALPVAGKTAVPEKAMVVRELPEDWYPKAVVEAA